MCEIKELSREPCLCARSKNSQEYLASVRDQRTLKNTLLVELSRVLLSVRDQRTLKSTLLECEITLAGSLEVL